LDEIPVRELKKVFDNWVKLLTAVTRGMEATYLEKYNYFRDLQRFNLEVQLA
jgi:hypothetical protein